MNKTICKTTLNKMTNNKNMNSSQLPKNTHGFKKKEKKKKTWYNG